VLHVIYRSYGGENFKGRPAYYSKQLALASFVRAVEVAREAGVDVEVLYLNDGAIPAERLALMARSGEIVQRWELGNKGSLRLALRLPAQRGWSDEDLVWFAEDDYLYLPHALTDLAAATTVYGGADYFALYGSIGSRTPWGGPQPSYAHQPYDWQSGETGDVQWRRGLSTTGTFGGRVRAIRQDRWLFYTVLLSGGPWDHAMCLLYQGFHPYSWSWLASEIRSAGARGPLRLARQTAIAAVQAGVNVGSALRQRVRGVGARRTLMAADPAPITHLEQAYLALGTDWTQAARDCAGWAASQGLPVLLDLH
jgi:hypothetical protein